MTLSTDDVERFWSKVDKSGECWNWTGGTSGVRGERPGYGRFHAGSRASGTARMVSAHRYAFEIEHGPIPDGLVLCHRCDNQRCVRPSHLFVGTHADNVADMRAKGRGAYGHRHWSRTQPESRPRGERHGSAKLTEADVIAMLRERAALGTTSTEFARRLGVNPATVRDALRGTTWSHLHSAPPHEVSR
jgi:hypothetical protein